MNTIITMALAAVLGMLPDSGDISPQPKDEAMEVVDDKKIVEEPVESKSAEAAETDISKENNTTEETQEPESEEAIVVEEPEIVEEVEESEPSEEPEPVEEAVSDIFIYSAEDLAYAGVIYGDSVTYTWYSEAELSGEGLDIPGRHHELGFVMDGDGNICVASCDYPRGTPISVPFGYGRAIVYDYCPTSGIVDVYMP